MNGAVKVLDTEDYRKSSAREESETDRGAPQVKNRALPVSPELHVPLLPIPVPATSLHSTS